MPEVTGIKKLFSLWAKGKALRYNQYATSQFGHSWFGDEDYYFPVPGGDPILISGIYRTDNVTGQTRNYREPYYITRNPRTELQQAHRQKYGEAVGAWRGLTPEEKNQYNVRAKGKRYSGWNLFYKEYLESN